MKKLLPLIFLSVVVFSSSAIAQKQERRPGGDRSFRGEGQEPEGRRGRGGPRPEQLGESDADLGSAGIVWFPILSDGLAEAKRSNKPILFMAVASQCDGISGIF